MRTDHSAGTPSSSTHLKCKLGWNGSRRNVLYASSAFRLISSGNASYRLRNWGVRTDLTRGVPIKLLQRALLLRLARFSPQLAVERPRAGTLGERCPFAFLEQFLPG